MITPNPMGNFNNLKGPGITKYHDDRFNSSDRYDIYLYDDIYLVLKRFLARFLNGFKPFKKK